MYTHGRCYDERKEISVIVIVGFHLVFPSFPFPSLIVRMTDVNIDAEQMFDLRILKYAVTMPSPSMKRVNQSLVQQTSPTNLSNNKSRRTFDKTKMKCY